MIAPEHDDRVVGAPGCVERVDQPANHGVGVTDARKIALHAGFPGAGCQHPLVQLDRGEIRTRGEWRDVIEIIGPCRRQLDVLERMQIEVGLWHIPGQMGSKNARGDKARPVQFRAQLLLDPTDDLAVT